MSALATRYPPFLLFPLRPFAPTDQPALSLLHVHPVSRCTFRIASPNFFSDNFFWVFWHLPFPGLTVSFGSPFVPFTPVPLTLNLLTTTIVALPSNASKWQMGFNSAFKGLTYLDYSRATFDPALSTVAVRFVETLLGFFKASLCHVTAHYVTSQKNYSLNWILPYFLSVFFFVRKYEGKVTLLWRRRLLRRWFKASFFSPVG